MLRRAAEAARDRARDHREERYHTFFRTPGEAAEHAAREGRYLTWVDGVGLVDIRGKGRAAILAELSRGCMPAGPSLGAVLHRPYWIYPPPSSSLLEGTVPV